MDRNLKFYTKNSRHCINWQRSKGVPRQGFPTNDGEK